MRGSVAHLPRSHRRPVFCERCAQSAAHRIEITPCDEPDLFAQVSLEPTHLAAPPSVLTHLRPVLLVTPEVLFHFLIKREFKARALECDPSRLLIEDIAELLPVPVARHPAPVQQRRRRAPGLPDPLRNLRPVKAAEIQHPERPYDCAVAQRLFHGADPEEIARKTHLVLLPWTRLLRFPAEQIRFAGRDRRLRFP